MTKTKLLFLLAALLEASSLLLARNIEEPSKVHIITVGEYHAFSKATEISNDTNIIGDENKKNPMLGLTKLDAMRFCNWVENGCLTKKEAGDKAIASTETGSYVLQGEELISINPTAMWHLPKTCAPYRATMRKSFAKVIAFY